MRLYLDDDSASKRLARLLVQAGHDVQLPADCGLTGMDDAIHLAQTVREDRALLTGNYYDFKLLHDLPMIADGHHPGLLVVRRDNDPKRDLTPRGIVQCIENLLSANIPLVDQFIILNQWR